MDKNSNTLPLPSASKDSAIDSFDIIVIDDESVTCSMVRHILAKRGHRVTVYLNSEEALAELHSRKPDIVITDLAMPRVSGIQIIKATKELYDDVGIIAISVDSRTSTVSECMNLGALDFIAKPFTSDVLLLSIANAMEKITLKRSLEATQAQLSLLQSAPPTASTAVDSLSLLPFPAIRISNDGKITSSSAYFAPYTSSRSAPVLQSIHDIEQMAAQGNSPAIFSLILEIFKQSPDSSRSKDIIDEGSSCYCVNITRTAEEVIILFVPTVAAPADLSNVVTARNVDDQAKVIENRMQAMFEIAPVGILEILIEGDAPFSSYHLRHNSAFRRTLGLSDNEIPPLIADKLPHSLSFLQDTFDTLQKGKAKEKKINLTYVRPDNEEMRLSCHLSAINGGRSNTPSGVLCIVEDHTEEHLYKLVLEASENRYKRIFEHAPIAIMESMVLEDGTTHMFVNTAFTAITGYTAAEFSTTQPEQITHPDDIESERVFLEKIFRREIDSFSLQQRIMHKDTSCRWIELHTRALENESGRFDRYISIFYDITDRKNAEQEVLRQQEILEQQTSEIEIINTGLQEKNSELMTMNRKLELLNEEKSEFMAIASHDLRNPLSSIIMKSEALLRYFDKYSKDQILSSAQFMLHTAQHMNTIIENFLDLYALESGSLSININSIEVSETIDHLIEDYRERAAKKNVSIHYQEAAKTGIISTDKNLFRQILDNLISNAVKYTAVGSNVYVRLSNIVSHTYRELSDGNHTFEEQLIALHIVVEDEGMGIPPEDIPHIFERFARIETTPTAGEPSIGLGLSVVKKLTTLLGGRVWCESEVNKGTKFHIEFPVSR